MHINIYFHNNIYVNYIYKIILNGMFSKLDRSLNQKSYRFGQTDSQAVTS